MVWLDWHAIAGSPARTSDVVLPSRLAKALREAGPRCWMITKARPVSGRRFFNKFEIDSNPPADAPMPTTGKESRSFSDRDTLGEGRFLFTEWGVALIGVATNSATARTL